MIQRPTILLANKLRLKVRSFLAATAVLAVCLPAVAADHSTPGKSARPAGDDPFAIYEATLDDAASRALKNVSRLHKVPPATETIQSPQIQPTSINASEDDTQTAWKRVQGLLPAIEPILRQVGVPVQLAAVILVESGGNSSALSPKGARGLWQLMPDTARRYGLIVNAETDQRLDVLKSTRAAAEYLQDLYAEFHDWPLSLAAYNAGEKAVQRAMAQTGGVAFTTAARALPAETQNYVPAVFHALAHFGDGELPALADHVHFGQAVYATTER